MFCDQTWPTTKNEIIFPRKGRFFFCDRVTRKQAPFDCFDAQGDYKQIY